MDLLGAEQSGHIIAVGYEYVINDIIAEAVSEARGEPVRRRGLPPFDGAVDAHIPDAYVPTAQQKMTLYRRIADVQSLEDLEELREELKDRFGKPPLPLRRLLKVMQVRALAGEVGAKSIAVSARQSCFPLNRGVSYNGGCSMHCKLLLVIRSNSPGKIRRRYAIC